MNKIYLLITIILMGCLTASGAGENIDFGFEKPEPAGWSTGGEGFRVKLDKKEAAGGKQSLCFSFEKEIIDISRGAFGFAAAQVPAAPFRGKRIRLWTKMKTRDLKGYFPLFMRATAGGDPVSAAALPYRQAPKGSGEWKKYSVEMDIPREAETLYFGARMRGSGTGWVDDFSIETLPEPGPQTIVIAGKIVDKDKKPAPGALVIIKTFYMETALRLTRSGKKGEFAFHMPPRGTYMLSAAAPGLTAAGLPLRNYAKDTRDLVIPLTGEGFTIKGKVEAAQGKIPRHTYVVANKLDFFGSDLFCVEPRADGSFEITVPTGISYCIRLDAPGLEAEHVVMASGSKHRCTLKAAPARPARPAPAGVVAWVKQQAVPLRTAEAGHGFADLQPLKKIIGVARVVGLGETSHGSREIFQMKHRLLEFLVEEMGFTVFAMETSLPNAFAVNEYVLHGKGDPNRLTAVLGTVWNTEEVLALIRWMRAYNADPVHQEKVKFFGVDVQGCTVAADAVSRYLQKVNPAFAKQEDITRMLTVLRNPAVYNIIYRYSLRQCFELKANLNRLLIHFERAAPAPYEGPVDNIPGQIDQKSLSPNISEKSALRGTTPPAPDSSFREWAKMRHFVRFLGCFVDYAVAGNTSDFDAIEVRDRAIAENIRWILDSEPAGAKIVYWAHNYHIATAQYPAFPARPSGMFLRRSLGNDYMAIGFEFNRGSFQSRDVTITEAKTPFLYKSFYMKPVPCSFAAAMSRAGLPIFLLDLRPVPCQGAVHDWFTAPHVFKSIDSVFGSEKDVQHLFRVPDYFDAVIFFEETSRARPNTASPLPRFFY